jgi:hypothetical protein
LRNKSRKCQATVIVRLSFSFRIPTSPYFSHWCVTTSASSCPFVATVCFNLAASTRFLLLPGTKCLVFPSYPPKRQIRCCQLLFRLASNFSQSNLAIIKAKNLKLSQLINPYWILLLCKHFNSKRLNLPEDVGFPLQVHHHLHSNYISKIDCSTLDMLLATVGEYSSEKPYSLEFSIHMVLLQGFCYVTFVGISTLLRLSLLTRPFRLPWPTS